MSDHKYRFGKTGKFLQWFMGRKIRKERRAFPEDYADVWQYVNEYYHLNRKYNIIAFKDCP